MNLTADDYISREAFIEILEDSSNNITKDDVEKLFVYLSKNGGIKTITKKKKDSFRLISYFNIGDSKKSLKNRLKGQPYLIKRYKSRWAFHLNLLNKLTEN
jgi:hypothetical protein